MASNSSTGSGSYRLRVLLSKMGVEDLRYLGNTVVPEWHGCPRRPRPVGSEILGVRPTESSGAARDSSNASPRNRIHRERVQRPLSHARLQGVRDANVLGVWSPNPKHAAEGAATARRLDIGQARPYGSIGEMVADPAIDAIWLCGANHARIENIEEIVDPIMRGHAELRGVACEKPLARNVTEAKRVTELVKRAGLAHGYLENQVFAPPVEQGKALLWGRGASLTGRPYPARAAEEHSGPHSPWFWQGKLQGGGVLNDMMCHSALVVHFLLTKPGSPLSSVKPVRITGHIASLKWTRPEYAKRLQRTMGKAVDYTKHPAEDFASITIAFETESGEEILGEATTSWSFVGPGLRLSAELLGPEYSMSWNSLDAGLKVFFSREVKGKAGEDLVEKAKCRDRTDAGRGERGLAIRLRGREPPLRSGSFRERVTPPNLRRRSPGCPAAHGGIHERRAGTAR